MVSPALAVVPSALVMPVVTLLAVLCRLKQAALSWLLRLAWQGLHWLSLAAMALLYWQGMQALLLAEIVALYWQGWKQSGLLGASPPLAHVGVTGVGVGVGVGVGC